MQRYQAMIVIFLFCLIINAAQAMTLPDADSPAAKTYAQRCSVCHSLAHPARFDWARWRHILAVMKMRMDEQDMSLPVSDWRQLAAYIKAHAQPAD